MMQINSFLLEIELGDSVYSHMRLDGIRVFFLI